MVFLAGSNPARATINFNMVNEFYQGLPSNYEDVVLPKHESMREKTRNHDHWNKDAYTWIDRFLEDSVGKKFDNVYSKVCERFRKKKDFGFREEFKSRIDPHNMSDGIVTTTIWIPIILLEGINLSRIISAESMLWSWIGQKITTL